jgi:hypothetical protein
VQGKSGNIYKYIPSNGYDIRWEQVSIITKNPNETIISSPADCGIISFLPIPPEEFIDQKSACVTWGAGHAKVVYGIDKSGRVYYWWKGWGEMDLLAVLIYAVLGGLVSIGFGIIIISLLVFSAFLNKKFKTQNHQDPIQV